MDTKGFFKLGKTIPGSRLTPVAIVDRRNGSKGLWYKCKCECGNIVLSNPYDMTHGKTKSCGCYRRDMLPINNTTHGLSKRSEYHAAKNAVARCTDPANSHYRLYGARGIKVKFKDATEFAKWLCDHLPKPTGRYCLDRKNNDRDYEKGNLRWATPKESARNHSGNRRVTINGKTRVLSEWSELSGVCAMTIHGRIKNNFPERLWLHKGKITRAVLFRELNRQ